jgi:Mg/Co/Ni transporter MgtE
LSPRAAWRLESLGFEKVFDYAAGKQDWLAFGLPIEGKSAATRTVGQLANREVPTCSLTDAIGAVQERMRQAHSEICVVVNRENVVLGLVRKKPSDSSAKLTVEEVMDSGPATFRPHIGIDEMTEYMREKKLTTILLTTSDGRLVGVLKRPK